MHPYERWILRRYLANALRSSRFARAPSADRDIVAWITEHARLLALPEPPFEAEPGNGRRRRPEARRTSSANWAAWRAAVMMSSKAPQPNPSPLQKRLDWLCRACSLTASQGAALGLLARATRTPQVTALVDALNDRAGFDLGSPDDSELAPLLDRTDRSELCSNGRLAELGLIEGSEAPRPSVVVCRFLSLPRLQPRRIADMLLGPPAPASLRWNDFDHMGDVRDLAARIVASADDMEDRTRRGVNLLFYGLPGTGKSEFAKTIGAHLGFSVQFCGETSDENLEPNRRERIAALLIANAIGGIARKTIVVVDEADDLFAGFDEDQGFGRRGSKVFMNRLLERSTAPTIWITNDIESLGPTIVRRMNLALRFPRPSLSVRRAMVTKIAANLNFRLSETGALDLARATAPPALIENAVRSAKQINGTVTEALTILDSSLRALGRREAPKAVIPIPFDPALSSADVDLLKLARQVAKSRERALSFCLSGPPGTGKSAYARHLAERLDLEVLEKRYSDLASMWLGEFEKAIATAFEEAADLRAFLILDEADSLLRDRSCAQQSWEVTQVNEMLTQMERHPYPFACTTNAPELLDAAAARRFLCETAWGPSADRRDMQLK